VAGGVAGSVDAGGVAGSVVAGGVAGSVVVAGGVASSVVVVVPPANMKYATTASTAMTAAIRIPVLPPDDVWTTSRLSLRGSAADG
jgi:hypothetical protein